MVQRQGLQQIKNALDRAIPTSLTLSQGQRTALDEIAAHVFEQTGKDRSFCLSGMSGVGKTQLLLTIAPVLERYGIQVFPYEETRDSKQIDGTGNQAFSVVLQVVDQQWAKHAPAMALPDVLDSSAELGH